MADSEKRGAGPERLGIVLGVAGSMAGNVAWAWDRSAVLVGVGIGMSLVLPVAVALWRAIPAKRGTWPWWERTLTMAAVVGGAALYSLVHTTLLLYGAGLPWSIAWVPAVVVELLVVMSARAGHAARVLDPSVGGAQQRPAARPSARKASASSGSAAPALSAPKAARPSAPAASASSGPSGPARADSPSAADRWERTRTADSGSTADPDTSTDSGAEETPAERRKRKDRERKARARAATRDADTSTSGDDMREAS